MSWIFSNRVIVAERAPSIVADFAVNAFGKTGIRQWRRRRHSTRPGGGPVCGRLRFRSYTCRLVARCGGRGAGLKRSASVDAVSRDGMRTAPASAMSFRPRIAIASALPTECIAIADWLTPEGFEPVRLSSAGRLTDELRDRSFDLLVVDAGLAMPAINAVRARSLQIPIVVLGEPNPVAESQAMARGAVYLTRPVDRAVFMCTVAMAIMESRPVRRSERKRARVTVVVQGVPSEIIDLSREGMRLEILRTLKGAPPPPVFDVAVPLLGVALNVRRLWIASSPPSAREAVWYGGVLSNNSRRVELAWWTLVDALPGSRVRLDVQ